MSISEKSSAELATSHHFGVTAAARANLHWAFMKLLMGTGWFPSTCTEVSWNMASGWVSGRRPMYFWLRRSIWWLMGTVSSCSERGTFFSFIL